jgi:drug/metabolite transporter (DMT)-like permease
MKYHQQNERMSNFPAVTEKADGRARISKDTLKLMLEPSVLIALAAIYVLWGTSYFAIKKAGAEFPPLLLVGLRNLAAGIFLLCMARLQSRAWGAPRLLANAAMVGVLMISVGATLLAMGIQHVTSGFAAVAFAAVPLIVCILLVVKGQRISLFQWVGTCIGVAGLVLMSYGTTGFQSGKGIWLIVGAVGATASAAVLMDHLSMPKDLFVCTGVQMMAGGGVASLLGWCMGERLGVLSTQAVGAWIYLTLLVSVLGYLSYTYLMAKAGPVMASSYAYVNPPVALFAGAWLLDEHVSVQIMLATSVVLIGAMTVIISTPARAFSEPFITPQEKVQTL